MIIANNKPLALVGYPESITIKEVKTAIEEEHPSNGVLVIEPDELFANGNNNYQYVNLVVKQDFKIRKQITEFLDNNNLDRFTYIHPSAVVSLSSCIIHPGVIIGPLVGIAFGVEIERDVMILAQAGIAHGCKINAGTYISGQTCIGGSTNIGKFCYFGMRSVVYDRVSIADDVTISVASVVRKSITQAGVYHGNPAKKLRMISR